MEKEVVLKAGNQYSLCTCGFSKVLPFCDETHKKVNEEKGTKYCSLKITPDKDVSIKAKSKAWER